MPTPDKFTPEARQFVESEKAKGTSNNQIATGLEAIGIKVSRKAVDAFVRKTGLGSTTKSKKATSPKKTVGFDEEANLKRTIRLLQNRLFNTPLTPREMASTSKELRLCLSQLRAAKAAARPALTAAKTSASAADALIAKLQKWAAENAAEEVAVTEADGKKPRAASG
jgi:hypothetical protein